MDLRKSRRRLLLANGKSSFTVKIVNGNSNTSLNKKSYVNCNSKQYYVGDSFECNKGDEIYCYLYGNWNGCQILLDGSVVAEAVNPTYTMKVESNLIITVAFESYGYAKMYIETE